MAYGSEHHHEEGDYQLSGHSHDHDHAGHSQHHVPKDFSRAFLWGIVLNAAFVAAEAIFGSLAHSLALLADAGHNLGDVLGLVLAWWAMKLGKRLPTERHTYGLRRASILAALLNGCFLLVAIGGIAWESVGRFRTPSPVAGSTVMWVAALGIVINSATAFLFMSGRKGDVNIRGAFLHMAADAAVSLGVVIAGALILWTGAPWIDPVVSLAIVGVIFYGTWGLLRESLNLALDAVPEGINVTEVKSFLESLPGVESVHDLHIWGMSTTEAALTAHLVMKPATTDDGFLSRTAGALHEKFKIEHPTLQIERGEWECNCRLAANDVL
jgi:cobalt-zinc-cadmium efflux system protein